MFPGNTLTSTAFERLLQTLDPDRDRAAAAYEQLRERVMGLLRWWGASTPSELADETIDRVARNLEEGATITRGSFGAYVRGVARLVFYESLRAAKREAVLEGDVVAPEAEQSREPALACLERCLSSLADVERKLVLSYYDLQRESKAASRKKLADDLAITPVALRIRAFRIRERLERCVSACLESA